MYLIIFINMRIKYLFIVLETLYYLQLMITLCIHCNATWMCLLMKIIFIIVKTKLKNIFGMLVDNFKAINQQIINAHDPYYYHM